MQPNPPAVPPAMPDILVVDDTPANLRLLAEMLKESGYRVRPVPSGKLAIEAARQEQPDLILLDVKMPEMNGYEVCERLKSDEALKEIPVLFISAMDETLDKIKAFAVGGVDYVTKPFQFEEVEARVRTHLKLRQLQVELESRNRQLQENYDQLRKLERLRDDLTHMIVHDMRSPLTGIAGYLELLELHVAKKLDSEELKFLQAARSSGSVLVDMVNSLLDISRMEQGKMPLAVTESDLDVLIQNALLSIGSPANAAALVHLKPPQPVRAACDANLVTRVIANLAGNALKFTPKEGRITVAAEQTGAGAKIRVADTGSGIPREFHAKIFEKFWQVEARQDGKKYSTGLGLTFCKLAIEAHGGEIGVESEVGKGSTFWFTLPAQPAPAREAPGAAG
ncbi:MAG TPA: hybrid sensor histidine kinase/response regulator [Verrucomicrobia bacterium]|nr:hybrid sensor histidine kinase/response regulator [Verrucomicrobiota bacterium]